MTITINLTEQDVAQASKSLIGLIQSCAEIDLPDTPHAATTGGSIIVPEKVYKDEPVPSPVKPASREKPKSKPAASPQAELIATELPTEEDSKPDETTVDYAELRKNLKAECAAIARTANPRDSSSSSWLTALRNSANSRTISSRSSALPQRRSDGTRSSKRIGE